MAQLKAVQGGGEGDKGVEWFWHFTCLCECADLHLSRRSWTECKTYLDVQASSGQEQSQQGSKMYQEKKKRAVKGSAIASLVLTGDPHRHMLSSS